MKIAFVYNFPFHILTALSNPPNEAAMAVSNLAIELAKLGHNITVFSQTTNKFDAFGIRCKAIGIVDNALNMDPAILETDYDAIIIKNASCGFISAFRKALPYEPNIYLWTSLSFDAKPHNGLSEKKNVEEIAGIICVSKWQRDKMQELYKIPTKKMHTLHYAIGFLFRDLYLSADELKVQKDNHPSIAYISNTAVGLKRVIDVFEEIQTLNPNTSLTIYSNIEKQTELKNKIEEMENTKIYGPQPIMSLISNLRKNNILAYPGISDITYCLPILESMCCGLFVLSSDCSSIPEYSFGYGKLMSINDFETDSENGFMGNMIALCNTLKNSANEFYDKCYQQVEGLNNEQTWASRARDLITTLSS